MIEDRTVQIVVMVPSILREKLRQQEGRRKSEVAKEAVKQFLDREEVILEPGTTETTDRLVPVNLYFPLSMINALDDRAKKLNVSRSALVRWALEKYL